MSSNTPRKATNTGATTDTGYFEKQRDMLIQEIANSVDSVVYNLEILNRSLNESIQIGKEFDDVGRLWSHFYDGVNQAKEINDKNEKPTENSE